MPLNQHHYPSFLSHVTTPWKCLVFLNLLLSCKLCPLLPFSTWPIPTSLPRHSSIVPPLWSHSWISRLLIYPHPPMLPHHFLATVIVPVTLLCNHWFHDCLTVAWLWGPWGPVTCSCHNCQSVGHSRCSTNVHSVKAEWNKKCTALCVCGWETFLGFW